MIIGCCPCKFKVTIFNYHDNKNCVQIEGYNIILFVLTMFCIFEDLW